MIVVIVKEILWIIFFGIAEKYFGCNSKGNSIGNMMQGGGWVLYSVGKQKFSTEWTVSYYQAGRWSADERKPRGCVI